MRATCVAIATNAAGGIGWRDGGAGMTRYCLGVKFAQAGDTERAEKDAVSVAGIR